MVSLLSLCHPLPKLHDVCRLQLDDLTKQHEGYARQLRDRLLREQDVAVEKERQAAQDRLREAAERYAMQVQCQCILYKLTGVCHTACRTWKQFVKQPLYGDRTVSSSPYKVKGVRQTALIRFSSSIYKSGDCRTAKLDDYLPCHSEQFQ